MATSKVAPLIRYSINLHDTLSQEKHINNGKDYPYFVVVKNVPFIIVVSSKGEPASFKKNAVSARLLYDCEPRKEVTMIRSAPIEYVTHISSNSEEMTIEARVHVLTSQHEDSLFRVCVSFNEQEILSDPLKIISKADNARKPSRDKGSPASPPTSSSTSSSSIKKKRSASDAFGDVLHRIDSQQQEQRRMIDKLTEQNTLLLSQLKQCTDLLQQQTTATANFTSNLSDFVTHFVQPTVLLDEVLDFESSGLFGDDSELLHLVPASPLSPTSSPDATPVSTPGPCDSLDGEGATRCDYLQV